MISNLLEVKIVSRSKTDTKVNLAQVSSPTTLLNLNFNDNICMRIRFMVESGFYKSELHIKFNPFTMFTALISNELCSSTIKERHLNMPLTISNFNYEKLNNYNISYWQPLLNNPLRAKMTIYYAQCSNLITIIKIEDKFKNSNNHQFINKGINFTYNYSIIFNLNTPDKYSLLHSNVKLTANHKHKTFLILYKKSNNSIVHLHFLYTNSLYLRTNTNVIDNSVLQNYKISHIWLALFLNKNNPDKYFLSDLFGITNFRYYRIS